MADTHLENSQVWLKSIDLVDKIYAATLRFPHNGNRGLGIQMQKASVSLASTIAKAGGQNSAGELIECMSSANGSLTRLKTQMIIAEHDKFLDRESYARLHEMCNDISTLIRNLLQPAVQSSSEYEPS